MRILSLGAGVQSTCLALMSAHGLLEKVDSCIFADTGWEPPETYAHLDAIEQYLGEFPETNRETLAHLSNGTGKVTPKGAQP